MIPLSRSLMAVFCSELNPQQLGASDDAIRSAASRLAEHDAQTEVGRSGGESVVNGGDSSAVLLRGVQHAAARHLQLGGGTQLAQAEGGACGQVQALNVQLCE
jgi:hypothetical protein